MNLLALLVELLLGSLGRTLQWQAVPVCNRGRKLRAPSSISGAHCGIQTTKALSDSVPQSIWLPVVGWLTWSPRKRRSAASRCLEISSLAMSRFPCRPVRHSCAQTPQT